MKKNKPIKLMVVTPSFYPDSGGVANHTYNIYKILRNIYGFEIVVVTTNDEGGYKEEMIAGMKIYRLKRWFKISNTPINLNWYFQIKRIIKKEQPDIINAHAPVPFISDVAAMVCGDTPFVLKYHMGSMKKGKLFPDILIWLYEKIFLRRLLNKSDVIITASEFITKDFIKDYSYKTITIPTGVDIIKFKPGRTNPKNRILFVANLRKVEDHKGLKYLLTAVYLIKDKIPDIKLIIIGDGDYRKYYEELCNDLKIIKNVIFKGRLDEKELVKEYQNTNLLILPSLFEATPNVLLEAMACKKPVVGSNVGGVPYLIDNNINGLLVPPENPQALADAIIKILNNKILAKQMGENGYNKIKENFTWGIQVNKLIKVYNNL